MQNIYLKNTLNNRNLKQNVFNKKILPFRFHLIPQFAIHLQDLKEKGKKSTQALFRENERLIKAKRIVSRALLHFQFLTWKTQH